MASFFNLQQKLDHKFTSNNLSAYIDGELDENQRRRVERHLQTCQACREDLATLRQTAALLKRAPSRPVPRSFIIPQSAVAEQRRHRRWNSAYQFMRAGTAVVSLLLVLLLTTDALFTTGAIELPGAGRPRMSSGAQSDGITQEAMEKDTPAPEAEALAAPLEAPEAPAGGAEAPASAAQAPPTEEEGTERAPEEEEARVMAEAVEAEPPEQPQMMRATEAQPAEEAQAPSVKTQVQPSQRSVPRADTALVAPATVGVSEAYAGRPTEIEERGAAAAEQEAEAAEEFAAAEKEGEEAALPPTEPAAAAAVAPSPTEAAAAAAIDEEGATTAADAQAPAAVQETPVESPPETLPLARSAGWHIWQIVRTGAGVLLGLLFVLLAGLLWSSQKRRI